MLFQKFNSSRTRWGLSRLLVWMLNVPAFLTPFRFNLRPRGSTLAFTACSVERRRCILRVSARDLSVRNFIGVQCRHGITCDVVLASRCCWTVRLFGKLQMRDSLLKTRSLLLDGWFLMVDFYVNTIFIQVYMTVTEEINESGEVIEWIKVKVKLLRIRWNKSSIKRRASIEKVKVKNVTKKSFKN